MSTNIPVDPSGDDLLTSSWDEAEEEDTSGDSPEDLADEVHAKPVELWPEDEDEGEPAPDVEAEAAEASADAEDVVQEPAEAPPELTALQSRVAELEAQLESQPQLSLQNLLLEVDTVDISEDDAIDIIQALMYRVKPEDVAPEMAIELERKKLERESRRRMAEIEAERAKFQAELAAREAVETESRYQAYLRDTATRTITNADYPAITTWFAGEDEVTDALAAVAAHEVRTHGADADLRAERLLTLLEKNVKSRLERAGKLKPRPTPSSNRPKPKTKERASAHSTGRQAITNAFDDLFGPE